MNDVNCPFRYNIRYSESTEIATCGLLKQVTGCTDDALCNVHRDACVQCMNASTSFAFQPHPVIPSLLYTTCERALAEDATPDGHVDHIRRLQQWAFENLTNLALPVPSITCCDVVLCCGDGSSLTRLAIESVLNQQDAFPFLHLVHDGGRGQTLADEYAKRPNIWIYRRSRQQTSFSILHDLVPKLRSHYVAVQDAQSVSRKDRLVHCISILEAQGADLLGAAVDVNGVIYRSHRPDRQFSRVLRPETLVIRRASLVDMGGFAAVASDEDVEFAWRAVQEGRSIAITDHVTVDRLAVSNHRMALRPPAFSPRKGSLRHHARGWPVSTKACDVVLPIHGHLDFAELALESAVNQEGIDVVIHLIDDASPIDTSTFMRFWSSHPKVRTYRNIKNIGPFASFNNVLPFCETDLVAVQDADDISCPNRLCYAAHVLPLAGADIFAGRSETFGEESVFHSGSPRRGSRTRGPRPPFRWSHYPRRGAWFFLENPTAVMRVKCFIELGGYADFGELRRNRTGVDTEFFARAYYAGAAFAISRDVVLKYRYHDASATQHPETGWGSPAQAAAQKECQRRRELFMNHRFDPRIFGALYQHHGLTETWTET